MKTSQSALVRGTRLLRNTELYNDLTEVIVHYGYLNIDLEHNSYYDRMRRKGWDIKPHDCDACVRTLYWRARRIAKGTPQRHVRRVAPAVVKVLCSPEIRARALAGYRDMYDPAPIEADRSAPVGACKAKAEDYSARTFIPAEPKPPVDAVFIDVEAPRLGYRRCVSCGEFKAYYHAECDDCTEAFAEARA